MLAGCHAAFLHNLFKLGRSLSAETIADQWSAWHLRAWHLALVPSSCTTLPRHECLMLWRAACSVTLGREALQPGTEYNISVSVTNFLGLSDSAQVQLQQASWCTPRRLHAVKLIKSMPQRSLGLSSSSENGAMQLPADGRLRSAGQRVQACPGGAAAAHPRRGPVCAQVSCSPS